MTPAVSIILPTVRPEGAPMVLDCLRRQTVTDWELLVGAPKGMIEGPGPLRDSVLGWGYQLWPEPPRRPGDMYALNKTWNLLAARARAGRLLFLVDWIWFPDDTLERFLAHPADVGASGVGHHYRHVVGGRPEGRWWTDPRLGKPFDARHMEMACAMLPRDDLLAVGGFDEEYDQVAGLSEKECCIRMQRAGARFVLDESISYRNWTHPKPEWPDWNQRYEKACAKFNRDVADIMSGSRLVVSNPLPS